MLAADLDAHARRRRVSPPCRAAPAGRKARHRLVALGAHVPDVGLDEYPGGHPGTGNGRRSSAHASAVSASRINTAAPRIRASAGTVSTAATIKPKMTIVVHMPQAGPSKLCAGRCPSRCSWVWGTDVHGARFFGSFRWSFAPLIPVRVAALAAVHPPLGVSLDTRPSGSRTSAFEIYFHRSARCIIAMYNGSLHPKKFNESNAS
jgi:hypothetical protein